MLFASRLLSLSTGTARYTQIGITSTFAKAGHGAPCRTIRSFATSALSSSQNAIRLRLVPLGGSVTFGQGSSDGNGYRNSLREMLVADGLHVDVVGSRKAGSMKDNAHEGWRGFRIDQIDKKARQSVPLLMPNIFTVNAGSNDCLQDFDTDHIGNRMARMLDGLWTSCPKSTIILSTLLVNSDEETESRILLANEAFYQLAARKAAENRKILIVDMHNTDGPQLSDLLDDGTHSTDGGYEKMARIWYRGIQEAVRKGFIENAAEMP